MGSIGLRRSVALLSSALLLASLFVVTTATPVAAQPMCHGEAATLVGTPGDDDLAHGTALFGTPDDDVIVGLGGDDDIFGLGGNDTVCGGGGEDNIEGGPGNDVLDGGGRRDTIDGGDGNDLICGGFGNDILRGGLGIDSGDDQIEGGPGFDRIFGGWGEDSLFGYVFGNNSIDCPGQGRDLRDIIRGQGNRDLIFGGPGNDDLFGGGGADAIRGGRHNDDIDGGPASDDCHQNTGRGTIVRCETADLVIRVFCPSIHPEGPLTCTVRVTNRGPDATRYVLKTQDQESRGGGTVNCSNEWEGEQTSFLRAGKRRVTQHTASDCSLTGAPPGVIWFAAEVDPDARDPRPRNNSDDGKTTIQ